jgi:hypothetical protein
VKVVGGPDGRAAWIRAPDLDIPAPRILRLDELRLLADLAPRDGEIAKQLAARPENAGSFALIFAGGALAIGSVIYGAQGLKQGCRYSGDPNSPDCASLYLGAGILAGGLAIAAIPVGLGIRRALGFEKRRREHATRVVETWNRRYPRRPIELAP